jgi:hypothetical protein
MVGESNSKEKAITAREEKYQKRHSRARVMHYAAQRAVNAKGHLVTEKGIDPSRISTATSGMEGQLVQDYLVPAGANFENDVPGTTPVNKSEVKPQKRMPLPVRHHRRPTECQRPIRVAGVPNRAGDWSEPLPAARAGPLTPQQTADELHHFGGVCYWREISVFESGKIGEQLVTPHEIGAVRESGWRPSARSQLPRSARPPGAPGGWRCHARKPRESKAPAPAHGAEISPSLQEENSSRKPGNAQPDGAEASHKSRS